jgi:hypothetical protein
VEYDRTSQTDGALIIDEIEVVAGETIDADLPEAESEREIPWRAGKWNNLKQYGATNTLALRDVGVKSPEAALSATPELLLPGVDFGYSSASCGRQSYTSDDYHFAQSLFSAIGGDFTQWHSDTQTDNFYIWRRFSESRNVKAVYWNSDTYIATTELKKFKFQYLEEGGNPNLEESWHDIPVVTQAHPYTGTTIDQVYKSYKDYLIANNDGEFYTDYNTLPTSTTTTFYISGNDSPTGLVVPSTGWGSKPVYLNTYYKAGRYGYVEFDTAVLTRGIRFFVESAVSVAVFNATEYGAATQIGLGELLIFCEEGSGSYLSPVFDTGTPQNTERVKAVIEAVGGSSASVFVRSSDEAPEQTFDPHYETWRSTGEAGKDPISFPNPPAKQDRAITIGDNTYFMLSAAPLVYDHVEDAWAYMGDGYPAAGSSSAEDAFEDDGVGSIRSPGILPDDRVFNHSALLEDGVIYTAAYETGDVRRPQIMRYEFSGPYAGWRVFTDGRPPDTEYASMAAFGRKLYFFNRYGPIYHYDIDEDLWVDIETSLPVYGGSRYDYTMPPSCTFENKVYFFGVCAGGNKAVDIFDFASHSFTNGTPAPFPITGGQAVAAPIERAIYVFQYAAYEAAGKYLTTMKYLPDEDRWETLGSLLWHRDVFAYHTQARCYYYKDGYIHSFRSSRRSACTRVSIEPWQHGELPDPKDEVWGSANIFEFPWQEIDSLGELMPQKRYFQLKVELYSEDQEHSPVLENLNIVTPQDVRVPASGTSNIYVKVGVSDRYSYQAWYEGASFDTSYGKHHNSILYTTSSDGLAWLLSTVASGTYSPSLLHMTNVHSPWVIRNSETSYDFWFDRNDVTASVDDNEDIFYGHSSDPADMSGDLAQEVISKGVVSQTDDGVRQPCVVQAGASDYRIWFVGYSSGTSRIFYATSTDGISWSGHQKVIDIGEDAVHGYDAQQCYRPCVLLEDGTFRLWYTAVDSDDKGRILYRESTDGINWGEIRVAVAPLAEGYLDEDSATDAFVMCDASTYYLYYLGWRGSVSTLIRADSPDGLGWTNFTLAAPSYGIQGRDDGYGIESIFVLANREQVIPGGVITTGKIKIYNDGAAL